MNAVPSSAAWRALALLIDVLGRDTFERALYDWVASIGPVSVLFAIEIFDDGLPGRVLVTEGSSESLTARARRISREYAEEDHVTDAVFIAHRDEQGGNELVLQNREDRDADFRLKYFDSVGAPQELSLFSHAGGSTLYLGASSFPTGYGADDIDRFRLALPLALSLVRRHAALVWGRPEGVEASTANREQTICRLLAEHQPRLTRREAEVCAAIVMGYRAETIAGRLGISPNTVTTHRKRAYAKLHISSQTELFGILFAGWSDRN